jgi:hypothetical protein
MNEWVVIIFVLGVIKQTQTVFLRKRHILLMQHFYLYKDLNSTMHILVTHEWIRSKA